MTLPAASFTYRAARSDGTIEQGVVHALTVDAASAEIASRGLFPLDVKAAQGTTSTRTKLSPSDLALGMRILANLLEAGLPMSRALVTFEQLAPAAWSPSIPTIRQAIREGRTLAAALSQSSLGIPPLVIGIIQAGEAGSGLPAAVRRSAELTEASAATRSAIRSALAYPIILAVAGSVSLALLVGIVLPRFANILAGLGQALPPTTQLVLQAGAFVRMAAMPSVIVIVVLTLLTRAWIATPSGRQRWDAMLLSLPIIGAIRFAAATSRVCRALASLLESGVPLAAALVHSARAAGDEAVAARLLRARESVVTGQRIGSAIVATQGLTPTAIQLVRAGEETGRLATMLEHAATLESERATQLVRSVVRLLEPSLILAFGAVIAVVAAALLQAVYTVRPHA